MSARPGDAPIIRLDRVTKDYHLGQERSNLRGLIPGRFGELSGHEVFSALDDVTLEIRAGEAVGIVGHNGAGKSTVLKMLAGIIEPTRGSVRVDGHVSALIELGAAFEPALTGRENVSFACGLLGLTRAEIRERFDDIVEFAGVGNFIDMPVKRYSTGMRARLGFAVATCVVPDILIVDEVLSVGDFEFQRRSYERIRQMHAAGATLVLVSHGVWMMEQLCSRLVLLEHGTVQMDGRPADVMARYLGPDHVAETDPAIGAPQLERYVVRDDPAPAVTIDDMRCEPATIAPDDPVEVSAEVTVHRPTDGIVVMAFYTSGRAVFAERIAGPETFLREVGTWTVTAHIAHVPINTGIYLFRFAILPEDSLDPDQRFETAIAERSTEVTIAGAVSARPGVYLHARWSAVPTASESSSSADVGVGHAGRPS